MSRKYMNDRWCVRCGRPGPCPFLKKELHCMVRRSGEKTAIVDIGCGSGRNTRYLNSLGYRNVLPFDMAGDFGHKFLIGVQPLPLLKSSVDVFLANYVFMFLSPKERATLLSDIRHAAKPGAHIMVELYPAKDSCTPDERSMLKLQEELFKALKWDKVKYQKARFIAREPQGKHTDIRAAGAAASEYGA